MRCEGERRGISKCGGYPNTNNIVHSYLGALAFDDQINRPALLITALFIEWLVCNHWYALKFLDLDHLAQDSEYPGIPTYPLYPR